MIDQSYTEATFSNNTATASASRASLGLAAEFLDVESSLLEARRKELFGKAENTDDI